MMATLDTNKQVVLVTGASGGVGQVLVQRLVDRGYAVIGSVLNEDELEQATAQGMSDATFFVADFSTADIGLVQLKAALAENGGGLHAAISCAGTNPLGPIETTPIDTLRRAMEINAIGNVALYQAAIPYLRNSAGRFIFVSSTAGKVAMPLLGYYTASKHALEGLVDTMRLEAGQWNIPVSLVQPGAIATKMARSFGRQLDAQLSQLDDTGRDHYGDYFMQQKAIGKTTDIIVLSPDAVADCIVDVLEAETPSPRYPIGGAIDLFNQRRSSTDQEMDAMVNRLLPGKRIRHLSVTADQVEHGRQCKEL